MPELAVSQLTADELSALEAQGVDLSKGTVPVPQAVAPKAVIDGNVLPTSKPVAAPPPPADVVARARERLKHADQLAGGSSYEEKTKDGKVVEQQGEAPAPTPEPVKKEEEIIDEADKAGFLVAMLGGGAFRKIYPLFGGRLEVTFQTRTAQQDAECASQAYKDDEYEKVANLEPAVRQQLRMGRYLDYQFIRSLQAMGSHGNPPRVFDVDKMVPNDLKHGVGASQLRAARLDVEQELAQPMRIALRSAHVRFENLVSRLTAEADKPDFWKAGSAT